MFKKFAMFAVIIFLGSLILKAQTGEEILDKAIEAVGGYEAMKETKTTSAVMSMSIQGMDLRMTVYNKKPAFRSETDMMGQKMVMVFDGQTGWMSSQGGVQEIPQEQIKQMRDQAEMTDNPLLKYKEPGAKIEKQGKEKVEDNSCFKLALTDKNNETITVYIDANDYLLKRIDKADKDATVEILLKDYKKVGKVMIAYLYVIKTQGMDMELKMEKFEVNPKLDDSLFTKPTK
jgi:zinc protease